MVNDRDTQKYLDSLPKKRAGTGALIFNSNNELLIVKPVYKDGWSVPGGTVEAGESPRDACVREIKEEVNLDIQNLQFLGVDYQKNAQGESYQFGFYAGVITTEQIAQIKVQESELSEFKFIPTEEMRNYLSKTAAKRFPKYLEAFKQNKSIYLENGE